MKTFDITIGKGRNPMTLDAERIMGNCLLIQGARDSGKSYLARVIIEQTIPKMQTIILDADGEFSTLREKFDILIASPDGDVPCEVRSAGVLARQIAETGVSAVVDFSDLPLDDESPDDRRIFVRDFLHVFNGLPKTMHDRPRLFVIDEAHVYCPEKGQGSSVSTKEIVLLQSQGRKRGFGAIFLTQRLAKLKNDAASECGTILVGKTSPIDTARAVDLLGIERKERVTLKRLKRGTFFGDGDALSSDEPTQFQVRKCLTTHPEPGSRARYRMQPLPPKRAIKRILKEFSALPPPQAVEDAASLEEARARIKTLERDLRKAEKTSKTTSASGKGGKGSSSNGTSPGVTQEAWSSLLADYGAAKKALVAAEKARVAAQRDAEKALDVLSKAHGRREAAQEKEIQLLRGRVGQVSDKLAETLAAPRSELPSLPEITLSATPVSVPGARPHTPRAATASPPPKSVAARRGTSRNGSNASSGFTRMLHALAQHKKLTKPQLGVLAGISAKGKKESGTFRNYVSKGKVEGLWTVSGKVMEITEAGVEAAGSFEPLPEGSDLVDYWKGHKAVPTKAGMALDYICSLGGDGALQDEVAEHIGIQVTSGTFRNYISRIRSLGLIRGNGTSETPFIGAEGMRAW